MILMPSHVLGAMWVKGGYKTPGNMLADGGGVFVVGDIARWSVGLEEKSVENIIYFFWESLKICNFAR